MSPRPFILSLLLALALTGCASSGYKSASGTDVDPQAYAQALQRVSDEQIPDPLKSEFVALYSEGPQNSVLHSMRAGLHAMRLGYYDIAKRCFDSAIRSVEALQAGSDQAKRSESNFVADREKWFKGESYERSALYFYRGLLYLKDQDYGNASACFKRSELEDITGDDKPGFQGDWYSDEIGLALASYLSGYSGDADNALKRAATYQSIQGKVPPPTPLTNTLIVIEVGTGPIKYAAGQYHEQLRFREDRPLTVSVRVDLPYQQVVNSAAAENLYFQATTRGTRQVDYILQGKANFKEGTNAATMALATASMATANADKSGITSGALALAALGSAITSALTTPEADVRSWDNLPHSIYLLNLEVPDNTPALTISGLDSSGRTTQQSSVPLIPCNNGNAKPFKIGFLYLNN